MRHAWLVLAAVLLASRDAAPDASPASSKPAAAVSPGPAVVEDHVPEIEAAVRALVGDRTFKDAQIGIAIVDVDSGHYLASASPHLALNPASNAKVYTAAVALSTLRGDHRFETTLSGTITGNEVAGLVLRGHGDPSLTTADLSAMVDELRTAGVRRVSGDIVVDQHLFDDQTTPPAFEQQPNEWAAFRAPVSAVAINENTVTLTVRPTVPGEKAIASFDPPGFVDVDGAVTTAQAGADTVGLELSPSGKRLAAKLSGEVGADARVVRYTRRVDDPTLLPGYVLRALLEQAQIKGAGEVKTNAVGKIGPVIARHTSQPLSTLLYELGKSSDNFYAEMIFKSLAGETTPRPARSSESADIVTRWLFKVGANDAGVVIKNGSGLFDSNRATAHSLAQVLRAAWRDPSLQSEFVSQLSVGGADGTLRRRFPRERLRHAVRAKTGTLDDAIALSGYVMSPPGKGPIAFSILFNHVAGKAGGARAAADTLVEMLVRRQWAESAPRD